MNKLLIILLAICLVSVHAFVKRDAETPKPNTRNTLQSDLEEFANSVKENFEKIVNPDEINKGFNQFVNKVQESIHQLSAKPEAPKQ